MDYLVCQILQTKNLKNRILISPFRPFFLPLGYLAYSKMQIFSQQKNGFLQCSLCPHNCLIENDKTGFCNVRGNQNGKPVLYTYEKIITRNLDPIEKKPLFHFFPGKKIFSIGSIGCNLNCIFCQNYEISQAAPVNLSQLKSFSAQQIVEMALKQPNNIGIAFTFNEPTVSFEYYFEIAKLSHQKGLKNVFVSNGYINQEPLKQLSPLIDAWNIDLKAFSNPFYKQQLGGTLKPVLETLKILRSEGRHLEITFLLIPGLNDSESEFTEMVQWISLNLGDKTPLHISRYFPRYKLKTDPTPVDLMYRFYEIASGNLSYVYLGNVDMPGTSDTYCPKCKTLSISRSGYSTDVKLPGNFICPNCGQQIDILS